MNETAKTEALEEGERETDHAAIAAHLLTLWSEDSREYLTAANAHATLAMHAIQQQAVAAIQPLVAVAVQPPAPDGASEPCQWCGRAIARSGGDWYAVKGVERGYDPNVCDANDEDGKHEPADKPALPSSAPVSSPVASS